MHIDRMAVIAAAAASVLAGCVNLKAVGTFADATTDMVTASDKMYTSVLDVDTELAASTVDLKSDQFEKVVGNGGVASEVRRHRAAVASLQAYATALKDFATFDQDKDIESASKDLASSLDSAAKSLNLAQPDESALATAITSMAKIYFDVKKRVVVRDKVREGQPAVTTVVSMLVKDAKRQRQRVEVNHAARTARREQLWVGLKTGYGKANKPEQAFRTIAASELVAKEIVAQEYDPLLLSMTDRLDTTARACLDAHTAIGQDTIDVAAVKRFYHEANNLLKAVRTLTK